MTQVTIIGRISQGPELRFTAGGDAVVQFSVAENHRKKVGQEWQDDGVTFWRCQAWKAMAENIAESLQKGSQVIVCGTSKTRSWTDKEGATRTTLEVNVDDVGPSLRWATAAVRRVDGNAGGQGRAPKDTAPDPWGSAPAPASDEPPF